MNLSICTCRCAQNKMLFAVLHLARSPCSGGVCKLVSNLSLPAHTTHTFNRIPPRNQYLRIYSINVFEGVGVLHINLCFFVIYSRKMWLNLLTITNILPLIVSKVALYVDDGYQQTVVDSIMSSEEKQELELDILNLLDLRRRPPTVANNKSSLKKSAPRFLMDIYKVLMDEENEQNSRSKRSLGLSGDEQQKIDESDVIMTLESVSKLCKNVGI